MCVCVVAVVVAVVFCCGRMIVYYADTSLPC